MAHSQLRNYFVLFRIKDGLILSETDLTDKPGVDRASLIERWEGMETSKEDFPGAICYYVTYIEEADGTFTIR